MKRVIQEVRLYCKAGKNSGKQLGIVKFLDGGDSYYYLMKRTSSGQLFKLPKYKDLLPVSTTIIEDLKKLKVEKLIFYLCLKDDFFFIVVPRKDFEEGELLTFDDEQLAVRIPKYPRHYEFPKGLNEYVR